MAYIKINNADYSSYCSALEVTVNHNYTSQTNAAGNTVCDYVNKKREISVTIIQTSAAVMSVLQNTIDNFSVSLTFLNPKTQALETISAIIPSNNVSYYTIQNNRKEVKATTLRFIEL